MQKIKANSLRLSILLPFLLLHTLNSDAQSSDTLSDSKKGDVVVKIFFNYHINSSRNYGSKSTFEIKRAYLGYKYSIYKKLDFKLIADFGKNTAGSSYTAFLKSAALSWKFSPDLKLLAGMIGTKSQQEQEKFSGYRYVDKIFADKNDIGTTADIGVELEYKIKPRIKASVFALNGEGYKDVQTKPDFHRYGADLELNLIDGLTAKLYFDLMNDLVIETNSNGDIVSTKEQIKTYIFFAGYNFKGKFRIGGEYNYLQNGISYKEASHNTDIFGYSLFAAVPLSKKFELFSRFDSFESNMTLNLLQEHGTINFGESFYFGLQYSPIKNINLALNYRFYDKKFTQPENNHALYVNLEFQL